LVTFLRRYDMPAHPRKVALLEQREDAIAERARKEVLEEAQPRYEYQFMGLGPHSGPEDHLNAVGREGWRVVSAQFSVNPMSGPGWDILLERALSDRSPA
jgi:hypothetical protein